MTELFPTHQVVVYVFRLAAAGPRYLILRMKPEQEGLWRPVLGTVRPEEVIEKAAIREVRDETGICAPKSLIDFGFRHREQVGDFDMVEWGVGYNVGSHEPPVSLASDYRDFRWLDFEEAYKTIEVDPFREAVLKLHLKLVG